MEEQTNNDINSADAETERKKLNNIEEMPQAELKIPFPDFQK